MDTLKDGILTLKLEVVNLLATLDVEETETILLTDKGVKMLVWIPIRTKAILTTGLNIHGLMAM